MFGLSIEPGVVMSWERFCREKPPYGIALDGYVEGPPRYDMAGPWVNLNHHEGVHRLATRATCEQVLVSIRMGLLEAFEAGLAPGTVYVNDVDEDVCLSMWLFRHFRQLDTSRSERIHRLVYLEGLIDTTAGAYPLPLDAPELMELAWIFKPFHDRCRLQDPGLLSLGDRELIVEEVGRHIGRYVRGRAEQVDLDVRYTVLGGGPGWALVKEVGVHARTAMRARGIRAFVTAREPRRDRAPGRHDYTLARMSPYVPFPIPALFDALNAADGISPDESDRWNGGDTVGGSPRKRGSGLDAAAVERVINETLKRLKRHAAPGGKP